MKRVFLYVRVSTEEQAIHGLSIAAQLAALEYWAKEHHHAIIGRYVDAGISGRKPASKRPELQRLLQDVRMGKGDLVVFTKLDRWFRNVSEYYKVQEILETFHVDWKTIHEDYDTSTAAGRLKINIMLAVAQDEADRTSERIKAVYEVKRQKMQPLSGSVPLGYKIEDKRVVKDPDWEDCIHAFFADYLAGGSISHTCRMIHQDYGIRLSYARASKMLSSKAYCGYMFGVDEMAPPYITPEQHEQIALTRKHIVRKTGNGRIYLFSGLLVCGACGKRMGGAYGTHSANPYYHCSGHYSQGRDCENSVNINEKKLADYIIYHLEEQFAQYKADLEKAQALNKKRNFQSEITTIKRKIDRLKQLFLDDLISLDEYKHDREPLMRQLAELEKQMQPIPKPNITAMEALLQHGWLDTYMSAGRETKKRFWRILLKEIRVYPDRRIEFDFNT